MQTIFSQYHYLYLLSAIILGLIVGSFITMVIYRLPIIIGNSYKQNKNKSLNLFYPASHCTSCKNSLTVLQKIPFFSYVALGGKCGFCNENIPKRYPVIEIFTSAITVLISLRFGLGWELLVALLLTWTLITLSVIDIDHNVIPNSITFPLICFGLFISIFYPLENSQIFFINTEDSIIGAIFGYTSLWCINWIFLLITKKEGIGYGDFKLLAGIGAFLGWELTLFIIVLSSILGSIIGISLIMIKKIKRNHPIPFGPYISISAWLTMMYIKDDIFFLLNFFI